MRVPTFTMTALASVALTGAAFAQTSAPAFTDKNGVISTDQFVKTRSGGEDVSCQDFLGLDDRLKPQAVSYVIGVNKAKDPTAKVVDVSAVHKLVPVIVSTCRSRPEGALADTVSTVIYPR